MILNWCFCFLLGDILSHSSFIPLFESPSVHPTTPEQRSRCWPGDRAFRTTFKLILKHTVNLAGAGMQIALCLFYLNDSRWFSGLSYIWSHVKSLRKLAGLALTVVMQIAMLTTGQ